MMTKKSAALLLALLLAMTCLPALAAETATALPLGVTFGMNHDELAEAVGMPSEWETWYEDDPEIGSLSLQDVALGIGDLTAVSLYLQVDRNNSAKAPRMCMLSASLEVESGVIASFRKALAAITEVYGQPDADPFDTEGVQGYVEYGSLYATWTKPDVRVNLSSFNRMYDENLSLDFTYRLSYDAADLQ